MRSVLFSLLLLVVPVSADQFSAKVVSVVDGDTVTVETATAERIKIRLNGIDAPEKGQPFSDRSKSLLNVLCRNKIVGVTTFDKDRYERWIADIVIPPSRSVNQEMVRQGLAWHYKKYSSDPVLAGLETEARSSKKGLWKDANPIAPWEWRDNPSLRPTPTPVPTPLPLSPVYQAPAEAWEPTAASVAPAPAQSYSAPPSPSYYVPPSAPAPSYGGYGSGYTHNHTEWNNVRGYTRKDGTYVRPHRRRTR